MPVILATQETEIKRWKSEVRPRQIIRKTLSRKNPALKKGWGVVQWLEHLPSKIEALSSKPQCKKKPKKQNIPSS
jgi:hypothetical protein